MCVCKTRSIYIIQICINALFSLAIIRSHRCCVMPGCIWGPWCDREWLPWPHLYPVGSGGAKLHHPAGRTPGWHLCIGCQWTHRNIRVSLSSLIQHLITLLFTLFFPCSFGSFLLHFCACLYYVYVHMGINPNSSVQGWDCIMCGVPTLPVDHEGSAVGFCGHFLWASGRHPVCQLYAAKWVGCQKCHCNWLCWWHHTGKHLW